MPIYKLNRAYESYRDGVRYGPWQPGDSVVLEDQVADWVLRDSPGVLTPTVGGSAPARPEPAAGARPRVGGDPDKAEAAAVAQERVHAESAARVLPPEEPVEELTEDDEATRAQPKARDRQQRGGRNRSG